MYEPFEEFAEYVSLTPRGFWESEEILMPHVDLETGIAVLTGVGVGVLVLIGCGVAVLLGVGVGVCTKLVGVGVVVVAGSFWFGSVVGSVVLKLKRLDK
jgi:small-conductance mechanosensitive channel